MLIKLVYPSPRKSPDHALEAGSRCFNDDPESAFVAGRYRYIAFDGSPLPIPQPPRPEGDRYAALLRDNFINMLAVVMYQRVVFEHRRGLDTPLDACEDYDLHLRMARDFPIGCHDVMVAEYRKHGATMTRDTARMLNASVRVLRRQRKYAGRKKHYETAYESTMNTLQDRHSGLLASEVLVYFGKHEWQRPLPFALTLVSHYPLSVTSLLSSDSSTNSKG